MNLLVTHRELDIAGYKMLELLSQRPSIKVYITADTDSKQDQIKGSCIPVMIPPLSSKFVWKSIKAIRKAVKEYDIDVIYSPSSAGLSNALFASLFTKAKNLAYRGTQAKVRRADPTYYLGVLNPRLKHLICVTEDIKTYLSKYIKESKLTVIPKPFDVAWVEDACASPKEVDGLPEDAFKCINIGAHKNRPFKGLKYLIEAFYLVKDPRFHLILIGDYDDSDYQLAEKGINEGRIHFLGYKKDALYYIPKQDLLVQPSLRDASPRTVKEAMACGVPCIVTDIDGARELVVDNATGILVPPASPEKIAEAIDTLMADRDKLKAFGKAGREYLIQKYSITQYVDAFEKLLKSL